MRTVMVITDSAQNKPPAGLFQEPCHAGQQCDSQIGHRIKREQQRADKRQVRQHRNGNLRQAFNRVSNQRRPYQTGQSGAKNRQRQPRGHLICGKAKRKQREHATSQCAGKSANDDRQP